MYKKLLEHKISSCGEQYFCHFCMSMLKTLTDALNHINEEIHLISKHEDANATLEKFLKTDLVFSNEDLAIIAYNIFECVPCRQKVFNDKSTILDHIKTEWHFDSLKNNDRSLYSDKDKVHFSSIKSKCNKLDKKKVESMKMKSIYENESTKDEDDYNHEVMHIKLVTELNSYTSNECAFLVHNGIVIVEHYQLMCSLCYCCLPNNCSSHFETARHKSQNKSRLNKKEEDLFSDNRNIETTSTNYNAGYVCELCKCSLTCIDTVFEHVKGKRHNKALQKLDETESLGKKSLNFIKSNNNQEINECVEQSDDCSIKEDNICSDNRNIETTSTNYNADYVCELCKCSLTSIDTVFEHVKGKRHNDAFEKLDIKQSLGKKSLNFIKSNNNQEIKECVEQSDDCSIKEDDICSDNRNIETTSTNYNADYVCELCKCSLTSIDTVFEHVKGKRHNDAFEKLDKKQSLGKKSLNFIKSNNNQEIKECVEQSDDCSIKEDDICSDNRNIETTSTNYNAGYVCELCKCSLTCIDTVFEHVKGKRHNKALQKLDETESLGKKSLNFIKSNNNQEINECVEQSDDCSIKEDDICSDNRNIETTSTNYNADYVCELCKCSLTSIDTVFEHVKGKRHNDAFEKLDKTQILGKKSLNFIKSNNNQEIKECVEQSDDCSIKEDDICSDNRNIETTSTNYNAGYVCELCKCSLTCIDTVFEHVKGKRHMKALQKLDETESLGKKSLNFIKSNNNQEINECVEQSDDCSIKEDNICSDNRNIETTSTNYNADYVYELCKCSLTSIDTVFEHVKGKRHNDAFEKLDKKQSLGKKSLNFIKSNNNQEINECVEQSDDCSIKEDNICSDNRNIETTSTNYNADYVCELCKCSLTSIDTVFEHVKGKRHNDAFEKLDKKQSLGKKSLNFIKSNNNQEINECVEQSDDCSIKEDDICSDNRNIVTTSTNYNADYVCELCKCSLTSIDTVFEHLKGKRHNDAFEKLDKTQSLGKKSLNFIKSNNNQEIKELSLDEIRTLCMPKKLDISDENLKETLRKLAENGILIHKPVFFCLYCERKFPSLHDTLLHIKSRSHINLLKINGMYIYKTEDTKITKENAIINQGTNKKSINIENKVEIIPKTCFTDNNNSIISNNIYKQIEEFLFMSPSGEKSKKVQKTKWLTERLNKTYKKEYLKIEEHMYEFSEDRLDDVELKCNVFIPHDQQNLYCLACSAIVSKSVHLVYEHVCLQSHTTNIYRMKEDDNGEEMLTQYMKKISTNVIQCYACNSILNNDTDKINIHIQSLVHKRKHKIILDRADDIIMLFIESLIKELESLWFSIQRFICTLCGINFEFKIEFIEHIHKSHSLYLKQNYVFDFCIPCAVLWLANKNLLNEHCDDVMHKYLMRSKDFMVDDLPGCIKDLLTHVDETVNVLLKQTEILRHDSTQEEVRRSLKDILRSCFPSVEVYLFGSRFSGLGFPNSDIDIYVDCRNRYHSGNSEFVKEDLTQIAKTLKKHEDVWQLIEVVEVCRVPIIKLMHKRTMLHCDISITCGLSVEKSKLIRSFIDAYPPCKMLVLFVKKWISLANLPSRHCLSSYTLVLLVIFYLQTESHLPSVARLIEERNRSQLICGWETGVAQPNCDNHSQESISVLLNRFFTFYGNFDYRHYIISPFMGSAVARKAFIEPRSLPERMKLYIKYINTSKQPMYFRVDTPLCVQDPFDLSENITKGVTVITLKYFRQYCQESAAILQSILQNM